MRRITQYFLVALPLATLGLVSGCNNNSVPPADGYYAASFTNTTTSATSTGYSIIDSTGAAVIVNQTSSTITRFVISSVDDNGNFTASTITFTGTTASSDVSADAAPIVGTITGTLNGNGGGVGGGSVSRNTITGTLTTSSSVQDFTLTYNSTVYETDATAFSTIATATSGTAGAIYNYTTGSGATTSPVQLAFTNYSSPSTSSSGIVSYAVSVQVGTSCEYTGSISQPNSDNAYFVSVTLSNAGAGCPSSLSGPAVYIPSSGTPATLILELDDSSTIAVAGYATKYN